MTLHTMTESRNIHNVVFLGRFDLSEKRRIRVHLSSRSHKMFHIRYLTNIMCQPFMQFRIEEHHFLKNYEKIMKNADISRF